MVVFGCHDGHSVCVPCFIDYCRHQLVNRQFIQVSSSTGYTIRCPAGCLGSEITEVHHFRLMGVYKASCTAAIPILNNFCLNLFNSLSIA